MRGPVVVVVGILLSGCAADSQQGADDLALEGSAGVLAGLVVDDAIRPVAGAAINVTGQGASLNTTSDDRGQFRLEGLAPGAYLVRASKEFYSGHEQAVIVETGVDEPELVRFQLVFEASSVPFATVYKYEGFHECGLNFIRVCSNINIATWIVICGSTGGAVCVGNVTGDRSLFFQRIDGTPSFIQAELFWEATLDSGRALSLVIGGGNESELNSGFASGYNYTEGESPLMLRITNHEGEASWCYQNVDDCEVPETLNYTRIGSERTLLGQVDAGPTQEVGGCGTISPCQLGASVQQKFTMITTVFYGYEPPDDWRFTETGEAPPPPPPR
ncbi:MAG: Carboxypeptidase regulatory-like domain [Thermoplasmata archaeon]|nr:Carboxypeptidase regulatory-like domain [Thermoplasmata archaeon]MEA3166561.1 Carboxypeptidase regulatory-like domain [Thermoplasmata archaeon]